MFAFEAKLFNTLTNISRDHKIQNDHFNKVQYPILNVHKEYSLTISNFRTANVVNTSL